MAQPRYTRIDNNRRPSSSYCSTVTIVVFVALCLVGIWMMTSSSLGPDQSVDAVSLDNKDGMKNQMTPPAEEQGKGGQNTGKTPNDESSSKEEEKSKEESTSSGETKTETEGGENKNDENGGGNDSDEKKPDEENPDSNEKQTKPETEDNESGEDGENQKKFEADESEKKSSDDDKETGNETKPEKENTKTNVEQESQPKNETSGGAQLELVNETVAQNGSFSTQATESKNEKEVQKSSGDRIDFEWKVCNTTAGPDYIPCLDNVQAIRSLKSTKHYEHRERHCPDSPPTCLVPLPEGYKRPIEWPKSREKIWYTNVPHTKLAEYKGHQNWVKVTGEYLTFPGGGTQFKHGALHYIDFIQESVSDIAWGKRSRVILDVGCGVASFGGFLFDRDVITMSLAPKDEHEAQVQFALERGIPAISAVMGTTRLPFPGRVFDIVHCARCRVPWHIEAMSALTKKMCWELISINKDKINGVGVATYKKPTSNECYTSRSEQDPPICANSDDPNASWYDFIFIIALVSASLRFLICMFLGVDINRKVPLQACMHTAPEDKTQRGSQWPEQWPARLDKPPYWLSSSQTGVYGKAAPEDFSADYEHWKRVVTKSYLKGLGINWGTVRNVMDMKAVYGGCNLTAVVAEVDRVLRPEGKLIVRDDAETIQEVEAMVKAMKWEVRMTYSKEKEGLLSVQKSMWRPKDVETLTYAIAT
ncbi:hypothetical protein Bca101_063560 [Brassica carinata]